MLFAGTGAWASGTALNTASSETRGYRAFAATAFELQYLRVQDIFIDNSSMTPPNCQKYNGTTWTEVNNVNHSKIRHI